MGGTDHATFFRDNERKIDFMLVYEETASSRAAAAVAGAVSAIGGATTSKRRAGKHEMWRQRFMANLRRVGLDMEEVS